MRLIEGGKSRIKEDTVLAIDIGDIDKPYAKKMEYLALVRDGSTGENRSAGYWTIEVIGADVEGEELVPLYGELYSQEAVDFGSENSQILKAVESVVLHIGNRGIWTMDRGGDRGKLLEKFLEKGLKFVIRLKGDRHLEYDGGKKCSVKKIVNRLSCTHVRKIEIEKNGAKEVKSLSLGNKAVYLPGHREPLTLVVVKGYGEKPMMLLTNLDVSKVGLDRILEIYLTRWKCEESYRFIKQGYSLEDIRLLNYAGLRNMMVMVQAVFYFVSVELGSKLKLNILLKKVYEKAKRFFEIPDFKQYALADGIYKILFSYKAWLREAPKPTNQLSFSFAILI